MPHNVDLLSELIGRKHECLRQLRDMGARQMELVRAGTITELLDVLSAKQRVLNQAQRIERQLDPFRNQDAAARRWHTEEQRRQCARQLDECEAFLSQIVDQEKQSQYELVLRRDQAADQLQGVHQADRARAAYVRRLDGGTGQIDLSAEG